MKWNERAEVYADTQARIAEPSGIDGATVRARAAVGVTGCSSASVALVGLCCKKAAGPTASGDVLVAIVPGVWFAGCAEPKQSASFAKAGGAWLEVSGARPRTAVGATLGAGVVAACAGAGLCLGLCGVGQYGERAVGRGDRSRVARDCYVMAVVGPCGDSALAAVADLDWI